MARRSVRISSQTSQQGSSPVASQSSPPSDSKKRKAEPGSSPIAKRGRKDQKEQKTIEESMNVDKDEPEQQQPEDNNEKVEQTATEENVKDKQESAPAQDEQEKAEPEKKEQSNGHGDQQNGQAPDQKTDTSAKEEKEEPSETKDNATEGQDQSGEQHKQSDTTQEKSTTNGDNAVEAHARDDQVPSSILEKGIIYFLYRGRVNIDEPSNVEDIARSYIILRPLPHGAKLSDGPIGDDKNCRLLAVPKKMLPLSGNDRWTAFVETANTSFKELKDNFMKSDDYTVQAGSRHTPAATPAAEGIYAITTTGRESHLAYILTLPESLGELQNDLGLRSRGSFVTSVKNPKAPGPANAQLGSDPGYSKELQNEFRSLRWAPLKPDHLNYESCQFLLVGEGENGLEKATEPQPDDEKKDETAKEEMEKLEGEDEIRVKHLNGEDAVFADLGTNAKEYPSLQTTW